MTALDLAALVIAPAVGVAFWFVLRVRRMHSRTNALVIAAVVLVEIYLFDAVLLSRVPMLLAGSIWVGAVYVTNVHIPQRR